jgi:hypothetical protein
MFCVFSLAAPLSLRRAMVNINDALHDGSNFSGNLMFNTCRESGDHG